jgi:protein-glutamine gamma-glutamyltransferase
MSSSNIKTVENKLKPAPPGLTVCSLLLWGWQTESLLYAIIMGLILELPFLIKWRIDFSDKDMNQLADLSGVIFFVVTVYIFINHSFQGIYKVLELLPFSLFILMLAQNYSIKNGINTSALFISIRRLGDKAGEHLLYYTNISLPFVFLCLISASSGNKYNTTFFLLSSLLIIWLLWDFRAKHYSLLSWIATIIFIIALSFVTQQGLQQLQNNAEALFIDLFEQYGFRSQNPNHASTSIGSLGRLKLSDRIVFRVKSDKIINTPLYFQESSYSKYKHGIWRNPSMEFDIIEKTPNKNEWQINKQKTDIEQLDIAMYLQNQGSIIPVPKNINSLSGNDLIQVETNPYGTTRIEAREGWISYRLGTSRKNIDEAPPIDDDLLIPLHYENDFKIVAKNLELYKKSPNQVINTVANYFKNNFHYSITQNQRYTKGQYLTKFLFKDKKGHCEYFATATALLLREAGIPARYTIGYSVQEYSTWQKMYLVRARHAHSWVKYYMNGQWHDMDTTPSGWAPMEAEDKTILEPLMDFFSWVRFKVTGSKIDSNTESSNWMLWLLIPLISYLAWRFYNKQRINTKKQKSITYEINIKRYGEDSPFYDVIKQIEKKSDKRLKGETLSKWINRVLPDGKAEKYIKLIKLHNRYRFNPVSDKEKDKNIIKEALTTIP